MAASKPTDLKSSRLTSLTTKKVFETLANPLGCFPFDGGPSRPTSVCQSISIRYSRFDPHPPTNKARIGRPEPYPRLVTRPTRCLDSFRGEPAITRLDWLFTPKHISSEYIATHTGSGLTIIGSPWTCLDRLASGLIQMTNDSTFQ